MLPCISSSPPVRKMKLHLWLNLLFYYLWQNSCSYNKFTFWSFKPKSGGWVNCLSVRSSNLLFALESDFAPVSTPDCQNNLFNRIRYFMEFRRLFKSTFVCSCVCLGCECFWSDVHIERWVWQHPLGVSWMFYDLAMFWQQGGRGGFSAQWLLGEHSIECILFCSRSISLSLFETLNGGALERGILSTIRPQTIPKTYQKYDWRTLKIKIEKWKLSRQFYTDYTNFSEYVIPIYNFFTQSLHS